MGISMVGMGVAAIVLASTLAYGQDPADQTPWAPGTQPSAGAQGAGGAGRKADAPRGAGGAAPDADEWRRYEP